MKRAPVFVDYYGIPEDPVTGSGNGCLAAYLVRYLYFGQKKVDARIEQGMRLGSLPYSKFKIKDGGIDVSVGGRVIMVAKGEFI